VAVGLATACATILGVEEPIRAVDAGAPAPEAAAIDAGCVGAGCPCGDDAPCRSTLDRYCVDGTCAECSPVPDSCPLGQYCLAGPQHVCVPGCSTDEGCQALSSAARYCARERRQCVSCRGKADCPNLNQVCSASGRCVDPCGDGGTCPGNLRCCAGQCVDPGSDVFHCGKCDAGCTAASTLCCDGVCTDPLTDPAHCGTCPKACEGVVDNATGIRCAAARCGYAACASGFGDCDRDPTNGCECAR